MEQYVYTYDSFAQRGAEQYVPTERFQVKSSVYLPASDIIFLIEFSARSFARMTSFTFFFSIFRICIPHQTLSELFVQVLPDFVVTSGGLLLRHHPVKYK